VSGRLAVVGLGPGPERWLTAEAQALLAEATDIVGYAPYVARVPHSGARRHASDNRVELDRAREALAMAEAGARVAVVSGGDPGVFAMAAAVFEAVEAGPQAWRRLPITVAPGVTAMLAAAARIGAPLGHDFCAVSLSDNLKPWPLIEKRLKAAVEADFVVALYNPASKARPHQIGRAIAILREAGDRVVVLARSVGRKEEAMTVTSLAALDPAAIDMQTLVIVGSSQTRIIRRGDDDPYVYTPRSAPETAP
jgi:precorrin-3B C17-methyltransferase